MGGPQLRKYDMEGGIDCRFQIPWQRACQTCGIALPGGYDERLRRQASRRAGWVGAHKWALECSDRLSGPVHACLARRLLLGYLGQHMQSHAAAS